MGSFSEWINEVDTTPNNPTGGSFSEWVNSDIPAKPVGTPEVPQATNPTWLQSFKDWIEPVPVVGGVGRALAEHAEGIKSQVENIYDPYGNIMKESTPDQIGKSDWMKELQYRSATSGKSINTTAREMEVELTERARNGDNEALNKILSMANASYSQALLGKGAAGLAFSVIPHSAMFLTILGSLRNQIPQKDMPKYNEVKKKISNLLSNALESSSLEGDHSDYARERLTSMGQDPFGENEERKAIVEDPNSPFALKAASEMIDMATDPELLLAGPLVGKATSRIMEAPKLAEAAKVKKKVTDAEVERLKEKALAEKQMEQVQREIQEQTNKQVAMPEEIPETIPKPTQMLSPDMLPPELRMMQEEQASNMAEMQKSIDPNNDFARLEEQIAQAADFARLEDEIARNAELEAMGVKASDEILSPSPEKMSLIDEYPMKPGSMLPEPWSADTPLERGVSMPSVDELNSYIKLQQAKKNMEMPPEKPEQEFKLNKIEQPVIEEPVSAPVESKPVTEEPPAPKVKNKKMVVPRDVSLKIYGETGGVKSAKAIKEAIKLGKIPRDMIKYAKELIRRFNEPGQPTSGPASAGIFGSDIAKDLAEKAWRKGTDTTVNTYKWIKSGAVDVKKTFEEVVRNSLDSIKGVSGEAKAFKESLSDLSTAIKSKDETLKTEAVKKVSEVIKGAIGKGMDSWIGKIAEDPSLSEAQKVELTKELLDIGKNSKMALDTLASNADLGSAISFIRTMPFSPRMAFDIVDKIVKSGKMDKDGSSFKGWETVDKMISEVEMTEKLTDSMTQKNKENFLKILGEVKDKETVKTVFKLMRDADKSNIKENKTWDWIEEQVKDNSDALNLAKNLRAQEAKFSKEIDKLNEEYPGLNIKKKEGIYLHRIIKSGGNVFNVHTGRGTLIADVIKNATKEEMKKVAMNASVHELYREITGMSEPEIFKGDRAEKAYGDVGFSEAVDKIKSHFKDIGDRSLTEYFAEREISRQALKNEIFKDIDKKLLKAARAKKTIFDKEAKEGKEPKPIEKKYQDALDEFSKFREEFSDTSKKTNSEIRKRVGDSIRLYETASKMKQELSEAIATTLRNNTDIMSGVIPDELLTKLNRIESTRKLMRGFDLKKLEAEIKFYKPDFTMADLKERKLFDSVFSVTTSKSPRVESKISKTDLSPELKSYSGKFLAFEHPPTLQDAIASYMVDMSKSVNNTRLLQYTDKVITQMNDMGLRNVADFATDYASYATGRKALMDKGWEKAINYMNAWQGFSKMISRPSFYIMQGLQPLELIKYAGEKGMLSKYNNVPIAGDIVRLVNGTWNTMKSSVKAGGQLIGRQFDKNQVLSSILKDPDFVKKIDVALSLGQLGGQHFGGLELGMKTKANFQASELATEAGKKVTGFQKFKHGLQKTAMGVDNFSRLATSNAYFEMFPEELATIHNAMVKSDMFMDRRKLTPYEKASVERYTQFIDKVNVNYGRSGHAMVLYNPVMNATFGAFKKFDFHRYGEFAEQIVDVFSNNEGGISKSSARNNQIATNLAVQLISGGWRSTRFYQLMAAAHIGMAAYQASMAVWQNKFSNEDQKKASRDYIRFHKNFELYNDQRVRTHIESNPSAFGRFYELALHNGILNAILPGHPDISNRLKPNATAVGPLPMALVDAMIGTGYVKGNYTQSPDDALKRAFQAMLPLGIQDVAKGLTALKFLVQQYKPELKDMNPVERMIVQSSSFVLDKLGRDGLNLINENFIAPAHEIFPAEVFYKFLGFNTQGSREDSTQKMIEGEYSKEAKLYRDKESSRLAEKLAGAKSEEERASIFQEINEVSNRLREDYGKGLGIKGVMTKEASMTDSSAKLFNDMMYKKPSSEEGQRFIKARVDDGSVSRELYKLSVRIKNTDRPEDISTFQNMLTLLYQMGYPEDKIYGNRKKEIDKNLTR